MVQEATAEKTEKRTFAEWRKAQGLTQTDVAKMVGVSTPVISQFETGGAQPTPEIKRKIKKLAEGETLRYPKRTVEDLAWIRGCDKDAPYKPLRWWREARFLSIEELAALSGVHAKTIRNLENNNLHMGARPHTRRKLARALEVLPDRLVLPGDKTDIDAVDLPDANSVMRAELGAKRRVLRQAYDFLRDPANITHRAQDSAVYDQLLGGIERELRGT
jgi:transcriptional regulator with XRE-family HTH domain